MSAASEAAEAARKAEEARQRAQAELQRHGQTMSRKPFGGSR